MTFVKILFVLDLLALVCAVLYLLAMNAKRAPKGGLPMRLSEFHFAHRGLHAIAAGIPENSVRAFRLAANNGYGAELDVHLSRDGRLVVMHDESLKRTAGANADISSVTSQVLNQLTLEGTKEKVPYLEDVLPLFEGKTPLIIEIKTAGDNFEELTRKVTSMLKQFPDLEFCIESFDPRVLRWLKKHHPEIIRGQLACNFFKEPKELTKLQQFALTNLLCNFLTKPDFIAYKYEDRDCLAPQLCKRIWGPQLYWWVVTEQEAADALVEQGDRIIFEGFAAK